MKRNAIITFDYEVFLGHNTGSVGNSVIRPTEEILKVLNRNKAKAIFFVDTTWLLFLKENFSDDFIQVSDQLKTIEVSGSSVELHLHPQWIEAIINNDGISFGSDVGHYTLHSLSNDRIMNLFKRSTELLENIKGKPVRCFRAGGWCVEPFERIKSAFDTFGIKYDFSVAPGKYIKEGKVYDFDFSGAPLLPFYRFNHDVQKPDNEGSYVEVPVSTYKNNPIYRLINKLLLKATRDKIFGDGTSLKETSLFTGKSLKQHLKISKAMLTIDKNSNLFFRYLLYTHFLRKRFLVVVSHPKIISRQALKNLDYFSGKFNTLNSHDLDLTVGVD